MNNEEQSFRVDTISQITVSTDSTQELSNDTLRNVQTVGSAEPNPPSQHISSLPVLIVAILVILIGLYLWRLINSLQKDMNNLYKRMDDMNRKLNDSDRTIRNLSNDLSAKNRNTLSQHESVRSNFESTYVPSQNIAKIEKSNNNKTNDVVRYATLQSPDGNGKLRFSERSMTETPTPQKLFKIIANYELGKGTYGINMLAISEILNDLQMFRDFVKPFTISGDMTNKTIEDDRLGTIRKEGDYWVVEEPLEIKITKKI